MNYKNKMKMNYKSKDSMKMPLLQLTTLVELSAKVTVAAALEPLPSSIEGENSLIRGWL